MTEKELSQLYFLKIEIKTIENEIENYDKSGIQASGFGAEGGNRMKGSITEKVALERVELKESLEVAKGKAEMELHKLEAYINSVDDSEIRLIMRLRHIEGCNWEQIGRRLHMHYTTVIRRYRKYLKEHK